MVAALLFGALISLAIASVAQVMRADGPGVVEAFCRSVGIGGMLIIAGLLEPFVAWIFAGSPHVAASTSSGAFPGAVFDDMQPALTAMLGYLATLLIILGVLERLWAFISWCSSLGQQDAR